MWIPEGMEHRRFGEWNRLVREFMEVWEAACLSGKEAWFQEQLGSSREGTELLDRLAELRLILAAEGSRSGYNLAQTVGGAAAPDAPGARSSDGEQAPERPRYEHGAEE
jgi:hypothetical protein